MQDLKCVKMDIQGKQLSVNIPDCKTVILRGRLNTQVLYTVESLLSHDMTGYYREVDRQYNYVYEQLEGVSQLLFQNGVIVGSDRSVDGQGSVPKIHCIRFLGNGYNKLRSFYLTDDMHRNELSFDLTKYTPKLSDKQWLRLVSMVNSVVGYEMCRYSHGSVQFDFDHDSDIDEQGRKVIYLLLAECFLTPEGYQRVLLLPDITCLYSDVQIKLLSCLDNIRGHLITLSTARVSPTDLVDVNSMILINV